VKVQGRTKREEHEEEKAEAATWSKEDHEEDSRRRRPWMEPEAMKGRPDEEGRLSAQDQDQEDQEEGKHRVPRSQSLEKPSWRTNTRSKGADIRINLTSIRGKFREPREHHITRPSYPN